MAKETKHTIEEMQSQVKTLKAVIGVMLSVIGLTAAYILYVILGGQWGTDKLPLVVSLSVMTAVAAINLAMIQGLKKKIALKQLDPGD